MADPTELPLAESSRISLSQTSALMGSGKTRRRIDWSADSTDTSVEEFSAFYVQAAPRLVSFLVWQGAPLADAADCAQDALAQCFKRWASIENPTAWCRHVALRLHHGRVRARGLEQSTDALEDVGRPLVIHDSDLDEAEDRHTLLQMLQTLPPRQREVVAWTYEGATPTEIARTLNVSPETVRSSLRKARELLRKQLRGSGRS